MADERLRNETQILSSAHRPFDHPEHEEPAFDGAVPQRNPPVGLEADQLRETQIAGEKPGGPSAEATLQRIPELRIERFELPRVRKPYAVRRVREQQSGGLRRRTRQHVRLLDAHERIDL